MSSASTSQKSVPDPASARDQRRVEAQAHLDGIGPHRAHEIAGGLWNAAPRTTAVFDPSMSAGCPEPVRRWLTHAIDPGARLPTAALLRMRGQITLGGRWRDYTARQVLVPDLGFVWAARVHLGRLPIEGYDAFCDGEGSMHWRMLGLPVRSASGSEVTRSAADRLAAETALIPAALTDATWHNGPDDDSAVYARRVGGRFARSRVTVRVAPDGRLASVSMARWGRPTGRAYGEHPFRVRFDGERRVDGFAVPVTLRAAWQGRAGSWDEFFRAHLEWIAFD